MRLGPALLVALLPLLAWADPTTNNIINSRVAPDDHEAPATTSAVATASVPTPCCSSTERTSTDGGATSTNATQEGATYLGEYPVGNKKKIFHIGYLPAVRGNLNERQGLAISGAITYALDQINRNETFLPNVTLKLKYHDTRGDTIESASAISKMICEGVAAFFGPEASCHVEAILSRSRNIPMFSYKCSDAQASEVETFARTEPPDTQVTKSVLSLLFYYNWKKFTIIYQKSWETVAKSLKKEALANNMTINDYEVIDDHCCEKMLKCCETSFFNELITKTRHRTRLYVYLGGTTALLQMMTMMQQAQLFDNGDYMVIYVDVNTYSAKETYKYLWRHDFLTNVGTCEDFDKDFRKRAQSLLVIVPTGISDGYENFTAAVRKYNSKEPFNFVIPDIFNSAVFVSIYAAYLYDSVMLYARALHELLQNESNLDDEKIDEIGKDGMKIIKKVISFESYPSISGVTVRIDNNGDSEGNFSLLALTELFDDDISLSRTLNCSWQMRPVAIFKGNANGIPQYQLTKTKPILWLKGKVPPHEPSCGFNNELCAKKSDSFKTSIVSAAVLGAMLFCAIVITVSIYRKWKIEQEIEGLLWKIDARQLSGYYDPVGSPSRTSIGSISMTSFGSRAGVQPFATTVLLKGVTVRIKKLSFSRNITFSRDDMKKMRLLRELRHDNVNSFIGACIDTTSILLVTDYCAKGSLYDIIENDDIELDRMFIASLAHDLIKGMLYLHNSVLEVHGNLKSSNCVVTSRWVLQVTDFGLAELRQLSESDVGSIGDHQHYRALFWKAPELLRHPNAYIHGTQKGDIYAFAIILYELIGRRSPPFRGAGLEPKEIIDSIKRIPGDEYPFRPNLKLLEEKEFGDEEYILQCIKDCWAEDPDLRPDFTQIRIRLKKMKEGKKNIMDQMMEMMVTYANHLEDLVQERTRLLNEEKMKTVDLLHRMLPKPVAEKLTAGCGIEPEWFDMVTIYFSDIVGFTAMSAESTPLQVVNFLNDLYTVFDRIIRGYDVYKVETIGDAYMVVSGLPVRNNAYHTGEIASMALDLLSHVRDHRIPHRPNETVKLRIGIHTGPVVAGVVGLTMPRYCLFGDTVNTASRMESNGEPLKIHISVQCKEALDKLGGYIVEERGLVNMKGKGAVLTYWLVGATDNAIQRREERDLEECLPLFCKPKRGSPKLNNDSRQASFCGGCVGLNSRRQSSVPRGTSVEVDSCSTLHNPSPLLVRNRSTRHVLHVPDATSKQTINSTFGSQVIDANELETNRRGLRTRRVLSSIASSCDEPCKSQIIPKVRESKSLDILPVIKRPFLFSGRRTDSKRSTKSLEESCEKCGDIQIIAIPTNRLVNNNFANGNMFGLTEQNTSSLDDVEEPLLNSRGLNPTIVQRKRVGSGIDEITDELASKRWKSLESLRTIGEQIPSDRPSKKNPPRHSIKSWIFGFFNGNGIKASNTVLNDYNSIQLEKESIV
ncbi:receptor-type guanylate cyclase Gyc76C-like [Onthophagus taurus]|uniref:receptor-type guanylate cyclase Gyc76C-like n=1 Tax=Onthophagus taurus TaxID=166361 RepID=UPI000C203584|nr:receptor-type guanylate cyclase Gyc76C-like [Onthophagus taurus]